LDLRSSPKVSPNPVEVVQELLANTTNADILTKLVALDTTYVSLSYDNPDLKKILPWAGTHKNKGPRAIVETFEGVGEYWTNEAFEVQALFGTGENVSVFGSFTYRSRTLGKAFTSPFSIWCKSRMARSPVCSSWSTPLANFDFPHVWRTQVPGRP